ncbi:glycerol-3-phosphate dehydrogenase subunit GlpB [Haloarchaeobius amylolyticus]|uniref:glycerol-3-phosphate dehydrogenase subunit GlpB n=1 Tax=Haloarchaeobius amylolyticus TaxID=1198296 RepID=UPI00226EDD36|nr:glycerol-3-phosphate dehydrogenase subunit GlpB [Haloarchaeobius amylolyticus]
MIADDVLVVGGGLAGSTAALAAAKTGADVRLVSAKESTMRQASGLADCLGYAGGDGDLLADPFEGLDSLPEEHPYTIAGEEAIREGFALFDEVTGDAYRGSEDDRNVLVPTTQGTVKPTFRYPQSMAAGLAGDGRATLLVSFEADPDFDAPLAARQLDETVPGDVTGVEISFPVDLRDDVKPTRLARLLAEDGGVRGDLARTVEPHLEDAGADRVGFPAVLGEHPGPVVDSLSKALGVPVFEVPTGPPSLPGMRLRDTMRSALRDAGVAVTTGCPMVGFEAEDGRIDVLEMDRNGAAIPHYPDQVVLATGGLVGRGIETDRESVREPLFGLHVPHPEDRYDWSAEAAFGDHAFARFGVRIDEDGRPLDADGAVAYENLRAAGSVVGGADFAMELSGSGISLATGWLAGTRAGGHT